MHRKSEIRDGMRIDWDAPIAMDDGVVLRADVFRPVADGKYPVILSYGPYAKGLAFQEGYKSAWTRMTTAYPETAAGLEQQVPELGAGRPREMGAGRLRDRAGRFARRRPLARLPRRVVAARGQGPARLRRVGGHAALEQRQGRHQRHFLLRHEPMARGAAAAAALGGAVHLGRLVRLLPRALPPRRHPVRLPGRLVAPPGHQRANGVGERGPKSPVTGELAAGPERCRSESSQKTAPTSPARRCGAA